MHRRVWTTEEARTDLGRTRLVSAAELYWKMMYIEGVVMGAWVLNLLHHTDGLKPELVLKLFPLTVK